MTRAPSLNPLRCDGTALPPNLLLAAKMIVLGLLLKGYVTRIPGVFLPMWPVLDLLPERELVRFALQATVVTAGVLLLCNRAVRACALAIGLTFVFATVASRGFYSNGRMFCSAMLILIGLYAPPLGIWLVRSQLAILYFGTGLNKILQPDWRSGRYFEHWMLGILHNDAYGAVASLLPAMSLSRFACWTTIALEFAIAVSFVVPRWYRTGICLALFFHLSTVVVTGMSFGIFVIAITFSLLAFVEWPRPGELEVLGAPDGKIARWVARLVRRLDFDRSIAAGRMATDPVAIESASFFVLRWRHRSYTGRVAFGRLLLSLPAFYFAAALLMIAPSLFLRWTGR